MRSPTVVPHGDRMRRPGVKASRSTVVAVTGLFVVGVMLLGAALVVGLRWPAAWWRTGPADATSLDYSALGTRLEPLSDG